MLTRLAMALAWISLALIAFVTLSPQELRPVDSTTASFVFHHFAAFGLLGTLFAIAYPQRVWVAVLIVVMAAISLELAQLLTPDRHARIADAATKVAGGLVGTVVGHAIVFVAKRARHPLERGG